MWKKPYEVEVSEFTSDVFPTEINTVLVNCFYKRVSDTEGIYNYFINAIRKMIDLGPMELYVAILYFDTCIYHEEKNTATFFIDKESISNSIKKAVSRSKKELSKDVVFPNGMKKRNPLQTIESFNKYYKNKYGISIM